MIKIINIDKKTQNDIYNLILKYTYSKDRPILILLKKYDISIDDFVNSAFLFYCEFCYKNFDDDKSNLSTHIYSCLNYNYITIIIQLKYNTSFNKAKYIADIKKNGEGAVACANIYNCLSYNTCTSLVDCDTSNSDEEEKQLCTDNFCDMESDPYYILNNTKLTKEIIQQAIDEYTSKIQTTQEKKTQLNKMLTYYINNILEGNSKKEDSFTYQDIGDKFGICRERVRQHLDKFYRWLRKNNKVRNAFSI